jgi:hypothetical protein
MADSGRDTAGEIVGLSGSIAGTVICIALGVTGEKSGGDEDAWKLIFLYGVGGVLNWDTAGDLTSSKRTPRPDIDDKDSRKLALL